jgi:hypothetical protein
MSTPRRKSAETAGERTVKTTVVLDVHTHAKLSALAALRGCDRSTIAADAIRQVVSSMVVFDRADRKKPSGPVTPDDEVDRSIEAA